MIVTVVSLQLAHAGAWDVSTTSTILGVLMVCKQLLYRVIELVWNLEVDNLCKELVCCDTHSPVDKLTIL